MFELVGDFGVIQFSQVGNTRYITIPTETAIRLFNTFAVLYPNILANAMGIYTIGEVDREGMVRYASLGVPKHILTARKNGCVWDPKGRMPMTLTENSLCPVEFMGEECPDAFWGGCLERIFGTGNAVRDFFSTAESRAIIQEILNNIYIGLGNSFYELADFGQHPLIADSTENNWFTVDQKEWNDYVDQQEACGGFVTQMDYLKNTEGLDNMNVPIYTNEIDGAEFIGDAEDLFKRLLSAAGVGTEFSTIINARGVGMAAPIIQVSQSIFQKYEDELLTKFAAIPEMYYYYLTGVDGARQLQPGVLRYKGAWVYCNYGWGLFDRITGTISHRAVVSAPGVFGLSSDVRNLRQFSGLGLRVVQHLDAPWMGKVYMDTTFKMGTAILNTQMLAMASVTLSPA